MPVPRSPFVKADSLYGSLKVLVVKPADGLGLVTGITGVDTGDLFTKTDHGYTTGDIVTPTVAVDGVGITVGTPYFVIVASSSTFQLAATYADAIAATPVPVEITTDYTDVSLLETYIFEADEITDNIDQSEFAFRRTDAAGVNRKVRTILTEQQESWTFAFDQAKRLPAIFAGGLVGRREILTTIYKGDPLDTSSAVALKSEADFPSVLYTEGGTRTGGGEGTRPSFRIESNKEAVVTWTRDAAV